MEQKLIQIPQKAYDAFRSESTHTLTHNQEINEQQQQNIDKNNNEIHKRIMNDDKAWRYNAMAIPTKQKYFRYSHSRPMEISVRLIEQSAKSFAQICF